MIYTQLPVDDQVIPIRRVYPEGTNRVLVIAPLKLKYYDLLLENLGKGLSYEEFPSSPASSEQELASEEVPNSPASPEHEFASEEVPPNSPSSGDSGAWSCFWKELVSC